MSVTTRLFALDDAPAMAALLRDNREFLEPTDPVRPDEYFTDDGQRQVIVDVLRQWENGFALPHVILDGDRIVGRITLTGIVRGAFQSAALGYWVAADVNGRGIASTAVARICRVAFDELDLHRLEAGTLVSNTASQRVLQKNGFVQYGSAPGYLHIAGRWQDHLLFQRLSS
nr:GNAT family protein [uncultured Actinoplanes sp.]